MDALGLNERLLLGSCQIHELQSAHGHVQLLLHVLSLHCQREDAVTPAREFIQLVRSQNFILRSEFEKFEGFLSGLAFENIEVLNNKLVLLRPSDSEPLLIVGHAIRTR